MALTKDTRLKFAGPADHWYDSVGVAASSTIYKGSMVGLSGGYARALTAGDQFIGHAIEQADNSSGSAADISVDLIRGRYCLEVTLSDVTRHDVGRAVYASDDGTLSLTGGGNSWVGTVARYVTTDTAVVEFCTQPAARLFGENAVRFVDDFLTADVSESADAATWKADIVDGDNDNGEVLAVTDDAPGGVLTCTTNDKANDTNNLQLNGESFQLQDDKPLWFEARWKVDDVDKVNVYVGLAITDTDAYGGVSDGIAFRNDHDGDLDYVVEKDSTETADDTGVDLEDDTWVTTALFWDGSSSVHVYVDGSLIASVATNVPDDEALTPTLCVETTEGSAHTLYVDYVKVVQAR